MKEIDYETRYPTKKELTKAYAEWFESKREDWTLFTVTVVFKPTDLNNGKERWEDEYTKRVLGKIRKAIEPKTANQTEALPFPNFFYFERNEASTFRLTKSRKPFHIHALLPIRNYQVGRMWSIDDGNVKEQLQKDFHFQSQSHQLGGCIFVWQCHLKSYPWYQAKHSKSCSAFAFIHTK